MSRAILPGRLLALTSLVTLTLFFFSANRTDARPPPFDPSGVFCLDVMESMAECDGDPSPGAASDLRSVLCVGWNADCTAPDGRVIDSDFGGSVTFTPPDWHLAEADAIPIGAIAGRYKSEATLGLLNGACARRMEIALTMMNGSVNTADAIAPRPSDETDAMEPLAADSDANGIPDGADRYPTFLAEYVGGAGGSAVQPRARLFGISHIAGRWLTVNVVFLEPGSTVEINETTITFDPALGYPGITVVQDPTAPPSPSVFTDSCAPFLSELTTLGTTIDNPCTPAGVEGANCSVATDAGPEVSPLGYPSLPCDTRSRYDDDEDGVINDGCPQSGPTPETGIECENGTSDDTEDSDVNDGCPSYGAASEGVRMSGSCSGSDEGGCIQRSNPVGAAAYTFTSMVLSQRDVDGDGIENGLDVCFDKPNREWNPRAARAVEDPDDDGLPTSCDPEPDQASAGSPNPGCKSGYTGPDEDQDCLANRADNCPFRASLEDGTKPPDIEENKPYAQDSDHDGIGDICDADLDTVNGEYTGQCLKFAFEVGGTGGPVAGVRRADLNAPFCASRGPVIQVFRGLSTPTPRPSSTVRSRRTPEAGNSGPGSGSALEISVIERTPETPSDYVLDFSRADGEAQFAGLVAYIPDSWGVARGETIPIGALVGRVTAETTVGLMGGACNTRLDIEFEMLNASIDIEDTVSIDDTNRADGDDTGDYAEDVNPKNGLPDSIDRYPEFINRVFDTADLQPIRRAAAISKLGGEPVLLQSLIFEPGTHIDDDLEDDPALGYPVVMLLENAGDPSASTSPGVISDVCSPLTARSVSFGLSRDNPAVTPVVDEGGYPANINPKDGVFIFATVGLLQRDADGDGHENSLDSCPLDTNVGSPHVTADGDLDQDGLDAACDPNDHPATGGANWDQDGDGYLNGQDNCPLAANGEDTTNQNDEDQDQIGDVCDVAPATADGELSYEQSTEDIIIGSGEGGEPPGIRACAGKGRYADADVCFRPRSVVGGDGGDSDGRPEAGADNDDAGVFILITVVFAAAVAVIAGGVVVIRRSGGRGAL